MGWKAIAGHLQVSVRTAQRWERLGSLPVHRPAHGIPGSIFAFGAELDVWMAGHPDEDRPETTLQDRPRSIAVLPFADLDGDRTTEILADGLTEDLINQLAGIADLRVVARTSVFHFKNRPADVREIAKLLRVDAVLEGSVRRSGSRARVVAQLIDAGTGCHLWSDRFDHDREDLFGIQDDIAHAIAGALRSSFAARLGAPSPSPYHGGSDTYELYLEGRYHWNRRTPAGYLKAVDCFRRVLEADPNMARAWSALSMCYAMSTGYSTMSSGDNLELATEAATRAMELDPALAEPHLTLGFISACYRFAWQTAEARFRRALELEPGMAFAHNLMAAMVLAPTGRWAEAEAHIHRFVELDPFSPLSLQTLARLDLYQRRYDRAVERFRASLTIDPALPMSLAGLAETLILQKRYEEALAELARVEMPTFGAGHAGYCQARMGRTEEARHTLRRLEELAQPEVAYQIAVLRFGLDDLDGAFAWLNRAVDHPSMGIHWIGVHPLWEPLQGDGRFVAVLERMNLA
jgi:serine/threonine-protein kinase